MDLFEVIQKRRSVRKFTDQEFPEDYVLKALRAAFQAPNSSNTQTWDFHWVKTPELKKKVVVACLSQSAARTANHLIVITTNRKNWKRSQKGLVAWAKSSKVHPSVVTYYEKLVPIMYTSGPLNLLTPIKWLIAFGTGLFRPIMRAPLTNRDIDEVAIKSAALAAENFVLAITAQGGATCMMEGFDEWRMKRALKLSYSTRVVMVIAVGYPDEEKGIWGPQYRISESKVIHTY